MQIVRVRSAAGGAALLALAGVLATGRDAGAAAGLAPSTGWEGERGGVVLVWPGAAPRSLVIEVYDHRPTTIEPPACVAYDVPREDLRFECFTPLRRCRRSIAVRPGPAPQFAVTASSGSECTGELRAAGDKMKPVDIVALAADVYRARTRDDGREFGGQKISDADAAGVRHVAGLLALEHQKRWKHPWPGSLSLAVDNLRVAHVVVLGACHGLPGAGAGGGTCSDAEAVAALQKSQALTESCGSALASVADAPAPRRARARGDLSRGFWFGPGADFGGRTGVLVIEPAASEGDAGKLHLSVYEDIHVNLPLCERAIDAGAAEVECGGDRRIALSIGGGEISVQLLGEGWRNPIWDHPGMTIDRRYAFRVRRGNLFAAFIAIDEMQQRMNHSGELGDADERARDAIAARIARLGPDAVRAIEDWSIAHVAALVDAAHEALASGCAATPEQPLGSCSQRNTDALLRDLLVQARANR